MAQNTRGNQTKEHCARQKNERSRPELHHLMHGRR